MEKIIVDKVWLTDTAVCIRTADGREACENFADYQRLKWATPEQRANYIIDEFGIHWECIDEDLCFENFFNKPERNPLYNIFLEHPELNAAAIARRMGMKQSLFAQYISGSKKPSKQRFEDILQEIRTIGRELAAIETF